MEIQMILHLPRDAVSVPVGRQLLDSCLETLGVTPDTRADIALALSEACANVVQHAELGEEYEVQVTARNYSCVIEVINAGSRDSASARDGSGGSQELAVTDEPVPVTAEHGRGLKIIKAVADNLKLTGNESQGATIHFEKRLEWVPGAPGQHLFDAGDGSLASARNTGGTR